MDYFSILELHREPFSNSPDPEFFFQSRQHQSCLQRLELALRLKRGLNVVVGDVGTGKTTLCRQLIRRFSGDPEMETHLILDPDFASPTDLLQSVASMFDGTEPAAAPDPWPLKERIKQALFHKGVDQKKTVVLIIDEGQKIPGPCLEALREFLNYETNQYKLLQIAIFAQPEFEKTLAARPNFADRINLKHTLGPMNFRDTREMIRYRLRQSSEAGQREDLFTLPGLWAVYRATGGYPRQIVHLCHQCLLAVIIQNRRRAGWSLVRSCGNRSCTTKRTSGLRKALLAGAFIFVVLAAAAALPPGRNLWMPQTGNIPSEQQPQKPRPVSAPETASDTIPPNEVREEAAPAAPAARPAVEGGSAGKTLPETPAASPAAPGAPAAAAAPEAERIEAAASEPEPVPASAPAEPGRTPPPEYLGTVVLQDRETLWRLVEKVYGVFEDDYLRSIRQANPQIRNPNRVEVGSAVRVPALPARVAPPQKETWWIRLDEKASLNDAIDALRNHPDTMPPIRIVPHWHPDEGLRFSVLLKEAFPDRQTADFELSRIRMSSQAQGELVSGWKPETVFYANPYRG